MALNDMYKQFFSAVGMDLERPASRRRLRDGSASNGDQSAQKTDKAHLKLTLVRDAQLRQLFAVVEGAWKISSKSTVAQTMMAALNGWHAADPGRGKEHPNGAPSTAVAIGFLQGLLATMPDVQKFQGNESQQQMFKSQFLQLQAEMNILTRSPNAKNRMAEQVALAMAKPTKKDKEMILIKIGWTLAAIPRNFASVIGDLMWTAPRPRAFRNLLEKPGRLSLGMSGSNCIDIGIQVQVSSSKCSGMDMKQPSLPKPSWRLHGGFLRALGCFLRSLNGSGPGLGRLLGGSWRLPRGILDQRP